MDNRTISMGGAAWHASFIAKSSKEGFVQAELNGWAYLDKNEDTRKQLLEQVYDIAVKQCPDLFEIAPKKKK